ncbi:MAG: DUF1275 domain-containing protein [Novosphingobium sp.]|nr:DUF1275 domain-containing protein [Novosphingobium sp.]
MERYDFPRQALAVCLSCVAGYVDAVGFMSADSYFVSFMSGNTTRLAVDLASDWRLALTPAALIAGFVMGVALGNLIATKAGRWRKPAVLALVGLLLFAGALTEATGLRTASLATLVLAMGALNNTFQRDGEVAIGLTYMTGALVRLGQAIGARLTGQKRSGWLAYLLLWIGLAGGALGGAKAFLSIGGAALWLATAAIALLVAMTFRLALRDTA